VWEDDRNNNWDIYGYNLLTGEEFQITTEPNSQVNPAIYKDTVIWIDRINIKHYVYGYSLSTSEGFYMTTDTGSPDLPRIYQNMVVWMDLRNHNGDIYGYDLSSTVLEIREPLQNGKGPQDKNKENGICLGTLFVAFILVGARKLRWKAF
jgi:beta propeller repeat protein